MHLACTHTGTQTHTHKHTYTHTHTYINTHRHVCRYVHKVSIIIDTSKPALKWEMTCFVMFIGAGIIYSKQLYRYFFYTKSGLVSDEHIRGAAICHKIYIYTLVYFASRKNPFLFNFTDKSRKWNVIGSIKDMIIRNDPIFGSIYLFCIEI